MPFSNGIIGVANDLTWDAEAFAVAAGYDEQSGRYLGLVIPDQDPIGQVTDQTLLVRPDLALAQRELEIAERAGAVSPRQELSQRPAATADRHARPKGRARTGLLARWAGQPRRQTPAQARDPQGFGQQ